MQPPSSLLNSPLEPGEAAPQLEGAAAHGRGSQLGASWWAQRWVRALEGLVDAGRLRRGQACARAGQVLSIEEVAGRVVARVQSGGPTPHKVTVQLTPLSDGQWEQVIDQMATRALFAAQLLAGEMPADVETAFSAAGASLFPVHTDDLVTRCTCADWASVCKHVAAVHYILAERFEDDPFMLFRLRGHTQEQVLLALRARRTPETDGEDVSPAEPEPVIPLEELVERFWQPQERLGTLRVSIRPPAVRLSILKRLGPATFWKDGDLAAQFLVPAYEAIGKAALAAALEGERPAEGEAED